MKIPYGWVREFVDVKLSAQDAADRLVNAGLEVASVTPLAPSGLRGVVVGEIESVERELGESRGHRLMVCRVRARGAQRFSVVCGAPNTRAGARAAFAPPGATLPDLRLREDQRRATELARVRIEAPDLCPRYTLRVIDGVRVAPSPAWMQSRLRAAGLRPISNVVDITNYVLWELGHPLHAFDAARVTDATIIVRRAPPAEP